jgi:hypothetical protein
LARLKEECEERGLPYFRLLKAHLEGSAVATLARAEREKPRWVTVKLWEARRRLRVLLLEKARDVDELEMFRELLDRP